MCFTIGSGNTHVVLARLLRAGARCGKTRHAHLALARIGATSGTLIERRRALRQEATRSLGISAHCSQERRSLGAGARCGNERRVHLAPVRVAAARGPPTRRRRVAHAHLAPARIGATSGTFTIGSGRSICISDWWPCSAACHAARLAAENELSQIEIEASPAAVRDVRSFCISSSAASSRPQSSRMSCCRFVCTARRL